MGLAEVVAGVVDGVTVGLLSPSSPPSPPSPGGEGGGNAGTGGTPPTGTKGIQPTPRGPRINGTMTPSMVVLVVVAAVTPLTVVGTNVSVMGEPSMVVVIVVVVPEPAPAPSDGLLLV